MNTDTKESYPCSSVFIRGLLFSTIYLILPLGIREGRRPAACWYPPGNNPHPSLARVFLDPRDARPSSLCTRDGRSPERFPSFRRSPDLHRGPGPSTWA